MQLTIKALDAAADDPNFVILEEWEQHELDQERALRILARHAERSRVRVGRADEVVWRRLRRFQAERHD
ncbi:MAG: hypothetical protein JWO36_2483 [Myxococcales bacterium]|nr:hypothetical protein [Myxococcales bacterium]